MAIYRAHLENRAVLKVTGAEREDFLQNLVTQDVTRARAQAAALLTPQGKLAFDFILQPVDAGFLIDCASDSAEAFVKKLNLYKLRRDVEITLTNIPVQVVWGDTPGTKKHEIKGFFEDPRAARLGLR
ncbi:MAG: folate-binding protein, partial [Pseudomonadota bacterium]|nr:folate-binding protein [Pseudomonadota bacterium]